MALPTTQELLDRIASKPSEVMERHLYPLDYAEKLIMEKPQVIPEDAYQTIVSQMRNPFSETNVQVVLDWWATKNEKENLYEFAAVLADVYLELHNIVRLDGIPALKNRSEWVTWVSDNE